MAKLMLLITLMTMALAVNGANLNHRKFLDPRNQFVDAKYPPPSGQNVAQAFITQRLDNLDPTNDNTWPQRYLMNGEFWTPGGCFFVLLGGNWHVAPEHLDNSLINEMSQEFGCYMFYLEHRYYGQSRPTE